MNLLHAILLGLIQGLTEFLPVSSTAHLTLAEHLMFSGRPMPLAFDVLLHVGTLVALVVYFRRELLQVVMGCLGRDKEGRRLAFWLFLAMIPTGIFGLATRGVKEAAKEHLWVYGVGLLCTAVMLWLANRLSSERVNSEALMVPIFSEPATLSRSSQLRTISSVRTRCRANPFSAP